MHDLMRFICLVLILFMLSCSKIEKWDFSNLDGWEYGHQDNNPNNQCILDNGILKIYTQPNSRDRKKIRTKDKIYKDGLYTWRTYIPKMGKGDQTSVGSWIYCDDHHELDFEVGYGKENVREKLKAKDDEMIVYMTSQDNPHTSKVMPIKIGWHIFEIDIKIRNGLYYAKWYIDGKKCHDISLNFGREISFYIYCSVENLDFIGEQIPKSENYGLFDFVSYKNNN